jgi:hypothetical protein
VSLAESEVGKPGVEEVDRTGGLSLVSDEEDDDDDRF